MKINLTALLLFFTTYTCVSAQTQFAANENTSRFEKKLDFSRPLTGNVANHTNRRRYATNANRPGVVQIGLGWGSVIGGAHVTIKDPELNPDSSESFTALGLGLTNNFGLRMQIGITEGFSAGFYIRKDIGTYVAPFDDFDLNGLSVGFEGKVYFINKDMFAVYVAPTIGYSFASSTIDKNPGVGIGLNYGLTAGLNWYWTDNLGMSCDLGYMSSTVNGIFNNADLIGLKYKIKYSGVYFGVGLVVKFGG